MVTIQQARTQIQQRQQEILGIEREIQRTALPRETRAELQTRGREDIIARQKQERQLESRKTEAIKQLDPIKREVEKAEMQVSREQAKINRFIY